MFKTFLMSSGAQIHRAPEDDRGHQLPDLDDTDLDFDDPEEGDDDIDDQDDGEHEDQDDSDAEDQDDEPLQRQAKKPSRQTQRVQALQRETREAREKADRLEREVADLRTGRNQQSQVDRDAAERDLLATMTPAERVEYRQDKLERTVRDSHQALALQSADIADRAAFDVKCAGSKLFASVKSKVEAAVIEARKQGNTASRETIAKYIIGEMVADKGLKVGTKQRRQAASNRDREQGRPGAARSDTRGSTGRLNDRAARAKRLEGQSI